MDDYRYDWFYGNDPLVRRAGTKREAVEQFGSWLQPLSPERAKHTVTPKVDDKARGIVKGQPYCKLKLVTFNPDPRAHIKRVLRRRGWVAAEFTKSGNAEIDENTVEALMTELPEVQGLGGLLMVHKRLSQLVEGDSSLVRCVTDDGRIHGVISPMGTMTSPATHFHPNLVSVPGAKKPYGEGFRDCFEMPHGWVSVGADMEGLEGRGFSRYMRPLHGGAYATALLSGDPHWAGTKNIGLAGQDEVRDKENSQHVILREGSKCFYYAFIYGREGNDTHTAGFLGLLSADTGPRRDIA